MTPTLDMKFDRPGESGSERKADGREDVERKQERGIEARKRVSLQAARGILRNLKNRCHVSDRLTLSVYMCVCVCVYVCSR